MLKDWRLNGQMTLPAAFQSLMQPLLAENWPHFLEALHASPKRAVRLHRVFTEDMLTDDDSKNSVSKCDFVSQASLIPQNIAGHLYERVPWTADGFYISLDSPLGKSVYHETGAFYIQEPSAMAVVGALDPQPGDRILDLCAAPGGKSTAIGRRLSGTGQLVANEIHPSRVVILAENLERLGIPALITNESPKNLADAWGEQFDKVLVDAPCSGEGMFRKDPESRESWSVDAPELCANRQKEILESAAKLLIPGGRLVYSTCTFNPLENERIVDWMTSELGFEVEELPLWPGWSPGEPEWASGLQSLCHTRRLWPHLAAGEGHFVASLRKREDSTREQAPMRKSKANAKRTTYINQSAWQNWLQEQFPNISAPASWLTPIQQGNLLFSREFDSLPLTKLRVLRPGIPLANLEKQRIEAHHALAMSIPSRQTVRPYQADEHTAIYYCRGEALPPDGIRGLRHIQISGLPLGWGKGLADRINNLYPKGLRRSDLMSL